MRSAYLSNPYTMNAESNSDHNGNKMVAGDYCTSKCCSTILQQVTGSTFSTWNIPCHSRALTCLVHWGQPLPLNQRPLLFPNVGQPRAVPTPPTAVSNSSSTGLHSLRVSVVDDICFLQYDYHCLFAT
jgi:hypothetical protein